MANFYGSICLSDIPRRLIKEVNGKKYLNIDVVELKSPSNYGDTHFIAASCKQEDRVDGENRFIGHLKPSTPKNATPTPAQIDAAPVAQGGSDDLPF